MADSSECGLSPRWKRFFLALGPLAAAAVYVLLPGAGEGALSHEARAAAAIAVVMGVWWLSEALPLEATALVPLVGFPLLGVCTFAQAAAPYANDVIYLFMGGLMLGVAMERWDLHKRLALRIILGVGTRPRRLILGVMCATAFLSMWVSNTATAVMMLPVGLSVLAALARARGEDPGQRTNFAVCLMLGIAYAATIGGIATIIGTPPNAVAVGYIERTMSMEVSFADWLRIGVPIMLVFLPLAWLVLCRLVFPVGAGDAGEERVMREAIRGEARALGRWTRGQVVTAGVFGSAALAWMFRDPIVSAFGLTITTAQGRTEPMLTDAGIAIAAALMLFILPAGRDREGRATAALDWAHARRIPWGVLLLFGGGLSLADQFTATGLHVRIGEQFSMLQGVHPLVIVLAITAVVVFATELGSNTAVATTFMPIASAVGARLGVDPLLLVVPTALAASYAFMMPTGTPPNALAFASGHLRVPDMVRAGLLLNMLSIVLITTMVYLAAGWMFGGIR